MWYLLLPVVLSADPAALNAHNQASSAVVLPHATTIHKVKAQTVAYQPTKAETPHFSVYSVAKAPPASEIAARCESLCAELRMKWLKAEKPAGWAQRCDIVLHSSSESYLAAVGRGGKGTRGSSLLRYGEQGVTTRRIDLLAEPGSSALSALPHEMTHVVLADRFGARHLPRWADEGLATMADSEEKQRLHRVDLKRGLATGHVPRMADLLFSTEYPAAHKRAAYYGASLSLVQYLSTLDHPERVLHFIERSLVTGHTAALREVYNIHSMTELERRWREHLTQE